MRNVEPRVYLIAKTQIDPTEAKRWVSDLGAPSFPVSEDAAAVTSGEKLVQLCGKRCYMSFVAGLNPNVQRVRDDMSEFIGNILKVGHGSVIEHASYSFALENVSRVFCYHPNTEVLTATGWKSVANVRSGECILTLNPETGNARWSVNHQTHSFEYSGPLYYWKNREDESPKVTPDHTLWCCPADLRKVRGLKAAEAVRDHGRKERFADMIGKRFFVKNAIGQIDGTDDSTVIEIGEYSYPSEEIMEWLGWVATDGTIAKPETGRSRVRVNQSKTAGVFRLRYLGARLFGDRCRVTGDHYKAFDVSDPAFYAWCVEMIGRTNEERYLIPLLRYSPRLVTAFLKGMYGGDGSRGFDDHQTLHCGGNERVAKQCQALVAVAGLASRITIDPDGVGRERVMVSGQVFVGTQPVVRLEVHRRGSGACMVKAKHQRVEHYAGLVHCPQTDDGIVYVRSCGKAVWCGNTGEMNRHRAGMAISEGSMRFIRFDNIPWWVPTSIQHNDDDGDLLRDKKTKSRIVFQKAFSVVEECYKDLMAIWSEELGPESKFKDKKNITSMMRRIVPMGVASGGVWTGNLRALRHIFTMRCSSAAEEEILLVASLMLDKMREVEPLFFGDFHRDNEGYWRPKYEKV